jgi:hypothetical protein
VGVVHEPVQDSIGQRGITYLFPNAVPGSALNCSPSSRIVGADSRGARQTPTLSCEQLILAMHCFDDSPDHFQRDITGIFTGQVSGNPVLIEREPRIGMSYQTGFVEPARFEPLKPHRNRPHPFRPDDFVSSAARSNSVMRTSMSSVSMAFLPRVRM